MKMREGDQQFEQREQLLGVAGLKLGHLAGTIIQSEKERLRRFIFRATRGKALIYFQDIENEMTDYKGNKFSKSVYIVVFQEGEYFTDKIVRILDSFLGNRFEINQENFNAEYIDTLKRIRDIKAVAKACYKQLQSYMKTINALEGSTTSRIELYRLYLLKEKCIFETLNKMLRGRNLFIGAFWIPTAELPSLEAALAELEETKRIKKPQIVVRNSSKLEPPTFIRTNTFTYPFQEITNTYGIPCYQEVNPSYFSIVTFPLLFGVMFGDIAHGSLLFLFSSFLCLFSD